MSKKAPQYLDLARGSNDNKAVERVRDAFVDPKIRKNFYDSFKELEMLSEIFSPDIFFASLFR